MTRGHIQKLIDGGFVTVNGESVRKSQQIRVGDEIVVREPEAVVRPADDSQDLSILYEDDYLVAIDKPPGLAVHGAPGDMTPCVGSWWLAQLADVAAFLDVDRPGIVHRLDKDTSGVLLLAKNPAAQAALSKAFEQRQTSKTYLAVCDGIPARERAVVDAKIGRHPGERTRMAITKSGRESRTEYEVLGSARGMSFIRVHPETGRTHQIRVHLAAIHAPIRFDRVYGHEGEGRQMLHAWQLTIPHPDGGTLTVTAPLAEDMFEEVRSIAGDSIALEYRKAIPPVLTRG
jgi:23S rRNA pseudouridine1911/1915/1917 synthase